jgi:hypothetical protein
MRYGPYRGSGRSHRVPRFVRGDYQRPLKRSGHQHIAAPEASGCPIAGNHSPQSITRNPERATHKPRIVTQITWRLARASG